MYTSRYLKEVLSTFYWITGKIKTLLSRWQLSSFGLISYEVRWVQSWIWALQQLCCEILQLYRSLKRWDTGIIVKFPYCRFIDSILLVWLTNIVCSSHDLRKEKYKAELSACLQSVAFDTFALQHVPHLWHVWTGDKKECLLSLA